MKKILTLTVVALLVASCSMNVFAENSGSSGQISAPGPTSGGTIAPGPTTPPTQSQTTNQTFSLSNPLKVNSIGGLVQNFVDIFSFVVILLAVLALIYVGFMYIMSQGKPEKMKELSNWLLWIVVGVAVVMSARLIVDVVINTLAASGTVSPSIIQSAHNAANGN